LPAAALPLIEKRVQREAGTGSLDGGGRASPPNDRDVTADERSRWPARLLLVVWTTHLARRHVDCGNADCTSLTVEDLRSVQSSPITKVIN